MSRYVHMFTMLELPKYQRKETCCESSVMLNVRFRRSRLLNQMLPVLALFSVFVNVYLLYNRKRDIVSFVDNSLSSFVPERTIHIESLVKTKEEILALELQEKKIRRHQGPKLLIPQPPSMAENATFSACLLIKDDNEILSEWIAYHYHTLNLRNLIVAVDPNSVESPSKILNRWRRLTNMNVSEWKDSDYMPQMFLDTGYPPKEYLQDESDFEGLGTKGLLEISSHRYRQRVFLSKCLRQFNEMGQTWTMHIDTDEFVVPSKLFREANVDYVKTQNITKPGSVLRLLQRTAKKTPALINYPCVSMMRMLFGSVEDGIKAEDKVPVPSGFNSASFETLRWRYHAPETNMTYHGNPKVIIDLSAIPEQAFDADIVYSIHRPIRSFCPKNNDLNYTSYHKQPIAANHYLGSYERYSGRSDKRRSRAIYDKKALVNAGTDEGIFPWLQGFTNTIGIELAAKLLGKPYLS